MELLDSILLVLLCVLWWIHEIQLCRFKMRVKNLEMLNMIIIGRGVDHVRAALNEVAQSVGQELAARKRDGDTT